MTRLRVSLAAMFAAFLAALPLHAAFAATPIPASIQISAPQQTTAGDQDSLWATVTDASRSPVPGVEVIFTEADSFLNTSETVEIGQAVTAAQGVAKVPYVPRGQGNITVTAAIMGAQSGLKSVASIQVNPGPDQFQASPIGVSVPGVGVWLLVVILGGIWFIFLWAVLQLRAISNKGQKKLTSGSDGLGGPHV